MSVLTKVLIVILLLLSVVYLGITSVLFAYRVDFKLKLAQEIKARDIEREQLTKEKNELQARVGSVDKANQLLSEEGKTKSMTIVGLQDNLRQANQAKEDILTTQTLLSSDIAGLKNEVIKYRDDNEKLAAQLEDSIRKKLQAIAARDAALQEKDIFKADVEKLNYDLNTLYLEHNKKLKELGELQQYLAFLQDMVKDLPQPASVKPQMEGKVLAVSSVLSILTINLGNGQGVKVGYEFIISRGPNFIADVKVYQVIDANHAACTITLSDSPIEVGDTVTIKK